MRIGFVGCGAIGSCYASYLSRKHEVCVLDTYAPVIESIKKNGILLDECAPGSGTGSSRPAAHSTGGAGPQPCSCRDRGRRRQRRHRDGAPGRYGRTHCQCP